MTKFLHTTFILLLFSLGGLLTTSSTLSAQITNLLVNPDFENYNNCPTGLSQSGNLADWGLGSSSPEYYNCSFNGNSVISGTPSAGSGSLGIWGGANHPSCLGQAYSESVVGQLSTALTIGKAYEVQFDLQVDGVGSATATANDCIDFGFYFYDQNTPPVLGGFCCKPVTPQVAVRGGSVLVGTYRTFTLTFTATGNFDRVLVGTYCNSVTGDPACANYYGTRMYFNIDNISVQEAALLPVEYARFDGKAMDNKNQLEWETVSETLNDYFEVEKCTGDCDNAANFANIGSVTAEGNATNGMTYRFDDEMPVVGANYYRIKQVDVNGSFSYSRILEIMYDQELHGAEVFPNPFDNYTTFRMSLPEATRVKIEVIDASGRVVIKETKEWTAGSHEVAINLANHPNGFYFLKAHADFGTGEGMNEIIENSEEVTGNRSQGTGKFDTCHLPPGP